MAETVISAFNSLMREKFYPKVAQTFHSERILMMMLQKITKEEINERGGRYPMRTRRANSFTGGSEGLTLPEPNPGAYEHFVPSLKSVYASGGFSNYVMWQQDVDTVDAGTMKGMKGMVSQQLKDETDDFEVKMEDLCFRDGKGKVTSAITDVTTGTAGTVTVDPSTSNYPPTEQLIGAVLNFYTSAGAIHNTGAATSTVTAVDEATGIITFDDVPDNCVVGDFPVWQGSWDLFPNGLDGIVQNQDITIQSVNVTGKNNLKSILFDAAGAGFDIKAVDRINVRTMKREGVRAKPEADRVIIANPLQLNGVKFAGYANDQIQTTSDRGATKLDLAYERVEIGSNKINLANSCGERTIWGLRLSALRRYSLYEPNLLNIFGHDNGWLVPRPASTNYKHSYLYFFASYGNLFIEKPTSCWKYSNLDKAGLG